MAQERIRVHTNDDFRVPRTLPASPPAKASNAAGAEAASQQARELTSPTGGPTPEAAAPAATASHPASQDVSPDVPFNELVARQDANGNWILVSRTLPPAPKGDPLPAQPLPFVSTGKPELDAIVMEMGSKYGVDPRLIVEVMRQESGFNPYAVSPAGAKGLMQLVDETAVRMGTRNVFDIRQNIEGGVKYLRLLLDMFNGDVMLALAGYNAGEHRVIRSGYRVPNITETRNYVKLILARYKKRTHQLPKPSPIPAPPSEPTPEPLRVIVRDGIVLLTNR